MKQVRVMHIEKVINDRQMTLFEPCLMVAILPASLYLWENQSMKFSLVCIGIVYTGLLYSCSETTTEQPFESTAQTSEQTPVASKTDTGGLAGSQNLPPTKIIIPRIQSEKDRIATQVKVEGDWTSDLDPAHQWTFKGRQFMEYKDGVLTRKTTWSITQCEEVLKSGSSDILSCIVIGEGKKAETFSILFSDGVDLKMKRQDEGGEICGFHRT